MLLSVNLQLRFHIMQASIGELYPAWLYGIGWIHSNPEM